MCFPRCATEWQYACARQAATVLKTGPFMTIKDEQNSSFDPFVEGSHANIGCWDIQGEGRTSNASAKTKQPSDEMKIGLSTWRQGRSTSCPGPAGAVEAPCRRRGSAAQSCAAAPAQQGRQHCHTAGPGCPPLPAMVARQILPPLGHTCPVLQKLHTIV